MRLKTTVIISVSVIALVLLFCLLYQPLTGRILLGEQAEKMGEGCGYLLAAVWLFHLSYYLKQKRKQK